jgi:transcriptional regulator with GAF, ATPase, and Fis domain
MLISSKVLSASKKHLENGKLFIEYPHLDASIWQQLNAELFLSNLDSLLPQVCIIIDYIHLLGLVHCDLKLSNFLIRNAGRDFALKLVDLDFLCEANSHPHAKVIGTPDHIPPEIRSNERIVVQSDNYSLGVSLKKCLESVDIGSVSASTELGTSRSNLNAMCERLTADEPLLRPRFLTEELYRSKLINAAVYAQTQKTLLSMCLLTGFLQAHRRPSDEKKNLRAFFHQNRVFGMSDELIDDLESAYRRQSLATFRIFRSLIDDASLERYGEYWHLSLPDKRLWSLYKALEQVKTSKEKGRGPAGVARITPSKELPAIAARYRESGDLEKSFLCLKEFLEWNGEQGADSSEPGDETVLTSLGQLAGLLDRSADARSYYTRLLSLKDSRSQTDLQLIYDLASLHATSGNLKETTALLQRGREEAVREDAARMRLRFQRLDAWVKSLQGEFGEALGILDSFLEDAARLNFVDLVVLGNYTLGVVYFRRGDLAPAVELFEKSYRLAKKENLLPESKAVLASLAQICVDLGEYRKAITYGKLAIKYTTDPKDTWRLPSMFLSLLNAYARLGEYQKAEYWLQRHLNIDLQNLNRHHLEVYFGSQAVIKSNAGDLEAAEESCFRALELFAEEVPQRNMAKVYHNLAEIALFRGDVVKCERYVEAARGILRVVNDKVTLAEIDLIDRANAFYNKNENISEELLTHLTGLVELNCRYYASLCLFHILLGSDAEVAGKALEAAGPLETALAQSEAPVFKVVSMLVSLARTPSSGIQHQIEVLKSAYRILERANQTFLALVVCLKIALLYSEYSKQKLARKFYSRSLAHAESLGNAVFTRDIRAVLESMAVDGEGETQLVESIHGISEIFKNISSYEMSIQRLVQFAVEATGAERGVLLLKKEQTGKLQVASFVNCDEDSLEDIRGISSSIPLQVTSDLEPLIIDNAVADKRTRSYESIVHHNILSVVCVPIIHDGRLLGTLYLDHHTIPALFEVKDVKYINSIANFMSIMLTTVQQYKSVNLINKQLIEDLGKLGNRHTFVTQDKTTLDLLNRLPEIARSNAPVLILGETGTGKEILAHMVHDLSLRSDKQLVKVNCSAIASSLAESELFGVAKNVATGVQERDGKLSEADGGSLLLDEIGDMPLDIQSKILRVVEYQEFSKVGSNRNIYSDIRFIYATNKDLPQMVSEGRFRQDLYYRINRISIEIPPLRERPQDIMLLMSHFVKLFSRGRGSPQFSTDALEALLAYQWPGNIRELKNVVERCCILCAGQRVTRSELPPEIQKHTDGSAEAQKMVESAEKSEIRRALEESGWNQSEAARRLKIPLSTFRRKLKKYNIRKSR